MIDEITSIIEIVILSFDSFWPYLLATIPLSVVIQMSGVSKYIKKALQTRPFTAILLATLIGAFSPFCSCGVIPVILSLLIGGIPLAPVMSFWIASPSMDPEIFFLSVATLGWDLAVWRLLSTLLISLSAGFITHYLVYLKWINEKNILRSSRKSNIPTFSNLVKSSFNWLSKRLEIAKNYILNTELTTNKVALGTGNNENVCCSTSVSVTASEKRENTSSDCGDNCDTKPIQRKTSFSKRVLNEIWNVSYMLGKFMLLAFLIKAVIEMYVPSEMIVRFLGNDNSFSILLSTLIGVPIYSSNLAALPLVGELLTQGMNPAAALAFLIAGPTTTLPAMAAVWGITNKRVFMLYLSFSLLGALLLGYIYGLVY